MNFVALEAETAPVHKLFILRVIVRIVQYIPHINADGGSLIYPCPGLGCLIDYVFTTARLGQHKIHVQVFVQIFDSSSCQVWNCHDFGLTILVFFRDLILPNRDIHIMQRIFKDVLYNRGGNHASELNSFGIIHCGIDHNLRVICWCKSDKGYDMLG
ncbi:hypothetical protein D3C74_376730 [compost metagenome]